jgi:hypothetical protein
MTIQVKTTDYEYAHGKKPRGKGNWAFFSEDGQWELWWTGSYSECKKKAQRAYARDFDTNYGIIKVGS